MATDPHKRDTTSGLSPLAIGLGLGTSALVWLVIDALKRFL
jgi:hypothetical protein